ncbi:myosin-11-like [Anthonomus grandis grandis]|uniref:myosin-11-like n=1 Tax=Anthonomus grandis grandis TaxID=2921223 RepID=UPI00216688C6|nr:myosin-11-like [Anthonomus grandis grandis]
MDTPGISLFQGADIQLSNSKNVEEEEDLEDQLRRKEELQNLLQANLDDFKYEDSTINSSPNLSLISNDNLASSLYKDHFQPNDQLKALFEIRCRELQDVREEFEKYRTDTSKELETQKRQNLLLESELSRFKISLKNSEVLLAEKVDVINNLNKNLAEKNANIAQLEAHLKNLEIELMAHKSEIDQLNLKLHSQNGPFNLNAKYNSEELRQSLQVKIEKLEQILDERTKQYELLKSENSLLKDDIERLSLEKLSLEQDNQLLLRSMDDAQQQCRDLIGVIEVLKKENDHFKGRLRELEQNLKTDGFIGSPNEKLKKMLVDKSVELDSLTAKLKHYESDMKELIEYRQLKTDIYKKDFQKCNNQVHTKDLLVMQNELQNYRRTIEDKNQQILILNSNNKDLKEKIEEMLLQTRNDIQNISAKYNMPQLESMQRELEKAEYTQKMLNKKLEESEQRRLSLLQKLENEDKNKKTETSDDIEKYRKNLKTLSDKLRRERDQNREIFEKMKEQEDEILSLRSELEDLNSNKQKSTCLDPETSQIKSEYQTLKNQLKSVMEHLEKSNIKNSRKELPEAVREITEQFDALLVKLNSENLEKGIIEEQVQCWKKMLLEVDYKDSDEALKSQYKEAIAKLHKSQQKLTELEENLQDLKNSLTISEGEKCSINVELKECAAQLQKSETERKRLEKEIENLNNILRTQEDQLNELRKTERTERGDGDCKIEKVASIGFQKDIQELTMRLQNKDKEYNILLKTMKNLEQEQSETLTRLEALKQEIEKLTQENSKLAEELKDRKNHINNLKSSKNAEMENEFKNQLEEEIVKTELKIRDDLQLEYQKRIADIEKRYQKTFKEVTEVCKTQKVELEQQEKKFREYLKTVLTECENCTTKLENEKLELENQLQVMQSGFEKYKLAVTNQEQKYVNVLKKMETETKKNNEAWKLWSEKVVCSCLDIEATNKKVRDRVLSSMDRYDQEVESIQRVADAKMKKKSSKEKS